MPLLLPEDYNIVIPPLYKVRQVFGRETLPDIPTVIRKEFQKEEISGNIKPGMRSAVAVGSRGIRNLPLIVKTVLEELEKLGANPFVVSAMGSHGGGTEEGQRKVLNGYGITEEAMKVPIITTTDVVCLGEMAGKRKVYFDKSAMEADVIIPVNRVKLHTDFVSDIQSGLCKMLVIGLGNQRGCTAVHEADFTDFGEVLKEIATWILEKTPVAFGIAVLENAYDETCFIEAIPAKTLMEREKELMKTARKNMPVLMIPEIDILIVEEIGKDISGAGFDPNILGKSYILKEFVLPIPQIDKMVLLDISPASHGNGYGLGIFDVIKEKVFEQLDYEAMYTNAIAVKCVDDCKIPLIAKDEEEAVRIAVKILRNVDKNNLKVVKIKNTVELEEIMVSRALLGEVEKNDCLVLENKLYF